MSKSNDNATLREGYVRKGGINPSPSQFKERPAPPASMHPATTESEKGASPSYRYFYTNPLAASSMANLQGMKLDPIPLPVTYSFQHDDVMPGEHGVRYRVHADSLRLLGPQVKDLAIDEFGKPFRNDSRMAGSMCVDIEYLLNIRT